MLKHRKNRDLKKVSPKQSCSLINLINRRCSLMEVLLYMQIHMDFLIVWIWKSAMKYYGTGYVILILDEMDYGQDLDKDSDPLGPSGCLLKLSLL